jgi:hypothetical protein
MIKTLIATLPMVLLAACATTYYSEPEYDYLTYEDDGYGEEVLIEDSYYDESLQGSPAHVLTETYVDASYYPWYSMDYFYLGSHHYRPYYGGSYYRPYYASSFSVGFNFGYPFYSPYDYPRYYAGWYAPIYYYGGHYGSGGGYRSYDPYWNRGYGRHGNYSHYDNRNGRGHGNSDNYGGRQGGYDNHNQVGYSDDRPDGRPTERREDRGTSDRGVRPGERSALMRSDATNTSRSVSVAPGRGNSDRGMVVSRRNDAKVMPSRTEPSNGSGKSRSATTVRNTTATSNTGTGKARVKSGTRKAETRSPRVDEPTRNKSRRSSVGVPIQSKNSANSRVARKGGTETQPTSSKRKQPIRVGQASERSRVTESSRHKVAQPRKSVAPQSRTAASSPKVSSVQPGSRNASTQVRRSASSGRSAKPLATPARQVSKPQTSRPRSKQQASSPSRPSTGRNRTKSTSSSDTSSGRRGGKNNN